MTKWTYFLCALWFAACGLAHAQELATCCESVSGDAICHSACTEVFSPVDDELSLSPSQVQILSNACPPSYVQFWTCFNQSSFIVENTSPPTTEQTGDPSNAYCCDESPDDYCRQTCHEYVTHPRPEEVIHLVVAACGSPPWGPVWQCFLQPTTAAPTVSEAPPPEEVDWARIQCCYMSQAEECRESCLELYSGTISSQAWQTFQLDCIHRPSESAMSTCLADVSTPCQLGCSGLQFCANFNNRPTESFRQCTASADRMAKNNFYIWRSSGFIFHPLIPLIVDVRHCHTDWWKIVACITHIQPCNSATHTTQICREDCLTLLGDCNNSTASPEVICDIIAPASTNDYCIPLSKYVAPSPYKRPEISIVTSPCNPNPCAEGFFCTVNHICRSEDLACSPYTCQPGCLVGDPPSFTFPAGNTVRVTMTPDEDCKAHYGYYNCTPGTRVGATLITDIQLRFEHCEMGSSCFVENHVHAHLSTFWQDCRFCSCFHGRTICTNRTCPEGNVSAQALGCNCTAIREPVCAQDGRTLPNECIAGCLGYAPHDYQSGECSSLDPCASARCGEGERCVPTPDVCLSEDPQQTTCRQYSCEPVNRDCTDLHMDPICDSSNTQHTTLCALLRTQEDFAYFGYCRPQCSRSRAQAVCGVNGETFETECHAESRQIAVDYSGSCTAVPIGESDDGSCADVTCPPLPHLGCIGVSPWDSCCPQCGAHLTILIDRESMQKNIHAMGMQSLASMDMIKRLKHHLTSLQCDLYGHISLDGSFSVLILPVINASSPVVIEVCNQEAVKLATLINQRSPLMTSDPILAHLVAAHVETSQIGPVPETDLEVETLPTQPVITSNGYRISLSCVGLATVLLSLLNNLWHAMFTSR